MKKVAGATEHPAKTSRPEAAGMTVVAVEPKTIVIVLNLEHLEVAVRVNNV